MPDFRVTVYWRGYEAMNTYHDRYARFGVIIGILVGVAIIAIIGLVSSVQPNSQPVIQPMQIGALIESGYLDYDVDGGEYDY